MNQGTQGPRYQCSWLGQAKLQLVMASIVYLITIIQTRVQKCLCWDV